MRGSGSYRWKRKYPTKPTPDVHGPVDPGSVMIDIPSAMFPRIRSTLFATAILVAGFLPTGEAVAQKTDVVILVNGDHITGEIKSLERGRLDYSTDDAGRLKIQWDKILRVTSNRFYEVEMSSGVKYFGTLVPSGVDGELVVELTTSDTLPITRVVHMVPVLGRFVDRLKAFLDVGFSLAKANKNLTLTGDGEVAYRGTKWGSSFSANTYFQSQSGQEGTTRAKVQLNGTRYFPKRWSGLSFVSAEQNEEQQLDLRASFGLGGGNRISQTNSHELVLGAGAVVTREMYSDTTSGGAAVDTASFNLEGLIAFSWEAFRFDSPKLDFSTSLTAYPSISALGRVRAELNIRVKYEVFSDFNVGLTFWDSFDSRPPAQEGQPRQVSNDYTVSLTIGWSYRR